MSYQRVTKVILSAALVASSLLLGGCKTIGPHTKILTAYIKGYEVSVAMAFASRQNNAQGTVAADGKVYLHGKELASGSWGMC